MSELGFLEAEKNRKVDERNRLLNTKWEIEDEISQLSKDRLVALHKQDLFTIGQINSKEKSLKGLLNKLNTQLKNAAQEIEELSDKIQYEKIRSFNSELISDGKLSDRQIKEIIITSKNLLKGYESSIRDYSHFLRNLESFLEKIEDDCLYYYLEQIKIKAKSIKKDLSNNKKQCEQCREYKVLYTLMNELDGAIGDLEYMKRNLNKSKSISKKFSSTNDDYLKLLTEVDSELEKLDEKFLDSNLKQTGIRIQTKIDNLLNYKKQCFKADRLEDLDGVLDFAKGDLTKIKQDFLQNIVKSKEISKNFDSLIASYMKFLNDFNSELNEVDDKFLFDDLEQMKVDLETKFDALLNFQKICIEFNRLDDFDVEINNTRKYLLKVKDNFVNSIIKSKTLSESFNSVIGDYDTFLLKLNFDFNESDDEYLKDVLKQTNIETENKKDDLLDFHEDCIEFNCLEDLNDAIDNAKDDLIKIKGNFGKSINKKLNELIIEAETIIKDKSAIFSKLNLILSDLIDNTKKFNRHIDKQELLSNLEKIKFELNQNFEILTDIKQDLPEPFQGYSGIQTIEMEMQKLNSSIVKLNQLNLEVFEDMVDEEEKNYNGLADLNYRLNSETSGILLDELESYFARPMFKRQLKKYNLNDDELDAVKSKIEQEIIDQIIIDDGSDLKDIIKKYCGEFRRNNSASDENEIDEFLENISFQDVDDEFVSECKDKVKRKYLEGGISINNVELKLRNCVNKKVQESIQLEELERIKNNPNVPGIKVHLTPEETNEIYMITENEILSKYGVKGNVENRVYYWINQKIRNNKSDARGKLNIIKRDFSDLTELDNKQQVDFIHQIEYYINENKIKHYDITEDYVVKLSKEFKITGKLML